MIIISKTTIVDAILDDIIYDKREVLLSYYECCSNSHGRKSAASLYQKPNRKGQIIKSYWYREEKTSPWPSSQGCFYPFTRGLFCAKLNSTDDMPYRIMHSTTDKLPLHYRGRAIKRNVASSFQVKVPVLRIGAIFWPTAVPALSENQFSEEEAAVYFRDFVSDIQYFEFCKVA